jgi:AraC-like DNA-binding protein
MDKRLYVVDSKNNLSISDMVKKIEKSVDMTTYYYNENYICGKTVQYKIFDGIWIVYHDLVLKNLELFPMEQTGFIRMNYCISGRCELEYKNHKVRYLGTGDFVIVLLDNENYKHKFPLGNYSGISVTTTEEKLDGFLKTIFGDTNITSAMLIHKIEEYDKYMALSNDSSVQAIIKEMIDANNQFWKERAILKFAELIMLLINIDVEASQTKDKYFDRRLIDKVKLIKKDVVNEVDIYITIEEIAKKYNISGRTFSDCFKEIYGKTYYAFIKDFRIKKAAGMLCSTNYSVGQIAITVGYYNASKFSKAFFSIMGVTPTNFRKNNLITVSD